MIVSYLVIQISPQQPPFSLVRFVGQILVGSLWSTLLVAAVPIEEVFGMNWTLLVYLAPLSTALGKKISVCYMVSCIQSRVVHVVFF